MSPLVGGPRPQVSVVIPVLDDAAGLERCLEALTRQADAPPFEVIVVDDGSTRPLEPVRVALAPRLPLVWRRHPDNRGPAAARNTGIAAARGEIVLFTDADCRPEPGWVAAMAAPFADPRVTGVKGRYRTDQTDLVARLAQVEFEERYARLAAQPAIDFVDTYSGAWRREDLVAVGGFDEGFPVADNEDVDLSWRIHARGGRFVFAPAAVVTHRHREGWWAYARLKFRRGFWRTRVYRRHPRKIGSDSYTPWTLCAQLLLTALGAAAWALLALCAVVRRDGGCCGRGGDGGAGEGGARGERSSGRFRRVVAAGAVLGCWLGSCLPLARHAAASDPAVIPWLPLFALVRSVAILAGVGVGAVCGAPPGDRPSTGEPGRATPG